MPRTIQRLLNGKNLRILGGSLDQLDNGAEGVIGMVKENVASVDGCEDVSPLVKDSRLGGDKG